jgi:hypothetical protein
MQLWLRLGPTIANTNFSRRRPALGESRTAYLPEASASPVKLLPRLDHSALPFGLLSSLARLGEARFPWSGLLVRQLCCLSLRLLVGARDRGVMMLLSY